MAIRPGRSRLGWRSPAALADQGKMNREHSQLRWTLGNSVKPPIGSGEGDRSPARAWGSLVPGRRLPVLQPPRIVVFPIPPGGCAMPRRSLHCSAVNDPKTLGDLWNSSCLRSVQRSPCCSVSFAVIWHTQNQTPQMGGPTLNEDSSEHPAA